MPATRPPAAVSLAAFTSSVDRFGVSPLLVILAVDFGVSLSLAVVVASIYFMTYGLSQPLWGMLSDRFGRLPLMRFALAGAVLCSVASACAPSLLFLTVARALAGGFFGAIVPASITYVGDTSDNENRQSMMSDLMAAVAVGTAVATAASGVIGQMFSWRVVFAVSAVLALVSLIPLFRLVEPERDRTVSISASLRL
ncbi:MAG: MFS transporter, partial [Micrococcus sp.]|nr:MFS transporter [Micrococcus sp.]